MTTCRVHDCTNTVPEPGALVCDPCVDELDEMLRVEMRRDLGREPTGAEMVELVHSILERRGN